MPKKNLSGQAAVVVSVLPAPSAAWSGVTVRLSTDNLPYWCDGSSWIAMTGGGGGGVTSAEVKKISAAMAIALG